MQCVMEGVIFMLIDNRYVPRHQKNFTICHWLNAISFLMLFLTALPLYADSFLFLYNIFGADDLISFAVVQNPDSLHDMTEGSITARYAVHYHGAWADEIIKDGKVTKKEIEQAG